MLAAHAGCEDEVAAVTERGDARRARLRGVAARAGRAARRARRDRARRGVRRARARPGRPHAGAHAASGSATGSRSSPAASPRSPTGSPPTSASTTPRANELEVVDGRLTGRIVGAGRRPGRQGRGAAPVRRRGRRRRGRRRSRSATAPTTSTCSPPPGSGIAFNAKPVVREAADTAVNVPYLDAIMYLLGITREEVEAADAEARHRHPGPAGLSRRR